MNHLIYTRRGAILYAASSPLLALLLMAAAPAEPVFLLLCALMAYGLCAWGLLVRWVGRRLSASRGAGPGTTLLTLLLALPMWFPAGLAGPVLYILSLILLARGQYPDRPWSRAEQRRTLAVIGAAAVLLGALALAQGADQNAPSPSPETAYRRSVSTAGPVAQLPQEDGSVLLIGLGGCAIAEEQENGWRLREIYQTTDLPLPDSDASVFASISRSPSGAMDVVTVWKGAYPGDDPVKASTPPRDSVGSEFLCETDEHPLVTSYLYYALVTAVPADYTLYAER